jgi:hypothetical protein
VLREKIKKQEQMCIRMLGVSLFKKVLLFVKEKINSEKDPDESDQAEID